MTGDRFCRCSALSTEADWTSDTTDAAAADGFRMTLAINEAKMQDGSPDPRNKGSY